MDNYRGDNIPRLRISCVHPRFDPMSLGRNLELTNWKLPTPIDLANVKEAGGKKLCCDFYHDSITKLAEFRCVNMQSCINQAQFCITGKIFSIIFSILSLSFILQSTCTVSNAVQKNVVDKWVDFDENGSSHVKMATSNATPCSEHNGIGFVVYCTVYVTLTYKSHP